MNSKLMTGLLRQQPG